MKVEAKKGGHVAASKLTVAQLIESYLETGTWSPTTLYGYQRLANREIIPALGGSSSASCGATVSTGCTRSCATGACRTAPFTTSTRSSTPPWSRPASGAGSL